MGKMLLDDFLIPAPERRRGRETEKPHVCFLGDSLNVLREHLWGGAIFGGLPERRQGLGREGEKWRRRWRWSLHQNIPDSGCIDARG